jgi:hypothetical protein
MWSMYFIHLYENRTMKPVEIISSRGRDFILDLNQKAEKLWERNFNNCTVTWK